MMISLVVAVAQNGVIGVNNTMPWHLPDDLRYFKQTTLGKTIIMGRKTYDSLGRPLPQRHNMVLTRNQDWRPAPEHASAVSIASSLPQALSLCRQQNPDQEVMIIGGAELFTQALPLADRLYFTAVYLSPKGDTIFPDIDHSKWHEISRRAGELSKEGIHTHDFIVFERQHA